MKMLLISNMYPNKAHPSYGVFVKNFEKNLLDKSIIIDKCILTKENNRILKIIKYFRFYLEILLKLILKHYDIVYIHYASHVSIPVIISNKVKRINIFVNVHGSDVIPEKRSQYKYQKYVKKLMEISNTIIVPSLYFKEIVSNKYNIKESKIFVSPSGGINKKKFYYIDNKKIIMEKYRIDSNKIIIGYVGRIDVGKGWNTFLEAINELKNKNKLDDKHFIIVGSGAQMDSFNKMINNFNINSSITHYNLLPQDELNNIYNIMDIFCFPTLRRGESLGLVGIEAMMCGVPVIGSRIGALPEYILEQETGMLFEAGNYKELCDKILKFTDLLYNNSKVKESYKEKCICKANNYRSDKVNDELYELLKNKYKQ